MQFEILGIAVMELFQTNLGVYMELFGSTPDLNCQQSLFGESAGQAYHASERITWQD